MDFIILAAGLSSRLENANKLLLPFDGDKLCVNTARAVIQARRNSEGGKIVIVTGFESETIQSAIRSAFPEEDLIFTLNRDFSRGQFSSTKTGLKQIDGSKPFFITLSDLPLIKSEHYLKLIPLLEGFDAVRPFTESRPGHPVLHAPHLRDLLLKMPDGASVKELLASCNVKELHDSDPAWTSDIDTRQAYEKLLRFRKTSPY